MDDAKWGMPTSWTTRELSGIRIAACDLLLYPDGYFSASMSAKPINREGDANAVTVGGVRGRPAISRMHGTP